jgi:hypothetical protein
MMFLIRTKENRISGPFPKEVILERMQSGELREMDEVCPASGYWIYLHERDESMKLLGVALAHTEDFHEESTETDTETVTATAPLAFPTAAPYAASGAKEGMREATATPIDPPAAPPPAPTGNRPEAIRALKFVLWVFGILIALILLRIYQVANPA